MCYCGLAWGHKDQMEKHKETKKRHSAGVAFTQREALTHESIWVKDELVENVDENFSLLSPQMIS